MTGAYFKGGDCPSLDRKIYIVNRNLKGRSGVKYLIFHTNVYIHPPLKKGSDTPLIDDVN